MRARSKPVVAGKSKRIGSISRLMPQKDDDPRQLSRPATRSRNSEHQRKRTHMNSNPTSGQISRSTPGQVEPDHVAPDGLSAEMSNLRRDVASLKDTFARLASQVGGEGAKAARSMSQTVAAQVGSARSGVTDAGSELASATKEHAKTLASELEGMAQSPRHDCGCAAGRCHHWDDVAGARLMFAALRSAVRADIDQQIGWAKDQLKRQTRYTALMGILAGVAALAARLTDHRGVRRTL